MLRFTNAQVAADLDRVAWTILSACRESDPSRRGRQSKQVAVNLGSGGPLVRAMTTNGGVRIKRTNTEQ